MRQRRIFITSRGQGQRRDQFQQSCAHQQCCLWAQDWRLLPKALNWLGVEFEGFYNQPDIKAQTITATGGGTSMSAPGDATKLRVASFAVNVLARYPGTTFQPYIGIGGGANVAAVNETTNTYVSDVAIAPALNALAGLRIFVDRKDSLLRRVQIQHVHIQVLR